MLTRTKRTKTAAPEQSYSTESTVIGPAFAMPEPGAGMLAMSVEMPIDFEARQDSISERRRSLGPKRDPKIKRTSARPAPVKETLIKI